MEQLNECEGIEGKSFVVTGGLGFIGSALCLELLNRGASRVLAFDIRSSSPWSLLLKNRNVRLFRGDVMRREDVSKAIRGADCVFHIASFGMSGKEAVQFARVDTVNVTGTCNVIESCLAHGVRRLVYVSTTDVVFDGTHIAAGDESLPYMKSSNGYVNSYNSSKALAEQLVLRTNGRSTKSGKNTTTHVLYTCAIRPGGIYGPGEERHLPRTVSLSELGLVLFRIGAKDVKTDWVYVDNLVTALLLASMALIHDLPGRKGTPIAAGQAYFITDGEPVNTYEFMKPLVGSMGWEIPERRLSLRKALILARICKAIYMMFFPLHNSHWFPQPFLLPNDVYKVGVTNYFSIMKARRELGYRPMVSPKEGMEATIAYWKERRRRGVEGPTLLSWFFVLTGIPTLFLAAYFPQLWPSPFAIFFSHYLTLFRGLFILAVGFHVAEAVYALNLARRVDPPNTVQWFLQTLILGIFSLRFLIKRSKPTFT